MGEEDPDLNRAAVLGDVLLVGGRDADAGALERLYDILVHHVLPLHGDLLPAKGAEEGVAVLGVLDGLETLRGCTHRLGL